MSRKPSLSFDEASKLVSDVYGLNETRDFQELVSYDDQNVFFRSQDGTELILKVTNCQDSQDSKPMEVWNNVCQSTAFWGVSQSQRSSFNSFKSIKRLNALLN